MKRKCQDAVFERVQRVVANGLNLQAKHVPDSLVLSEFFRDDFDVEELALEITDEFEDEEIEVLPEDVYTVMKAKKNLNNGTVGQLADRVQEILDEAE